MASKDFGIRDGEKALNDVRKKANDKKGPPTEELIAAYFEAERLKKAFTGSSLADEANSVMVKLFQQQPKVETENLARSAMKRKDGINDLQKQLRGKEKSFDPRLPEFQEQNQKLLMQLDMAVKSLRKSYDGTRAADEAARVAERWGLTTK